MTETKEQLTKHIDEVGQEIDTMVTKFIENVGDPAKSQENTRMCKIIKSSEAKRTELLKELARLCL
ncbi:hypothetical protein ACFLWR_04915 [Chloroflexota bacterium]